MHVYVICIIDIIYNDVITFFMHMMHDAFFIYI